MKNSSVFTVRHRARPATQKLRLVSWLAKRHYEGFSSQLPIEW